MTYPMTVAGLQRDLPICKVTDDLYIGAFIVFGDAELMRPGAFEAGPGGGLRLHADGGGQEHPPDP